MATPPDVVLWPVWDAIRVPRLVLRGESSDLLSEHTLARMAADGAATLACSRELGITSPERVIS